MLYTWIGSPELIFLSSTGIDAPTNQTNEDDDLQRALALSLGETTTPQEPQQTGILSASDTQRQSPVFGPATRNDHNVDEWAMIRASPAPMDSLPSARKRDSSKPVFLRCRQSDAYQMHRLGPFIMLLHSVPAARNLFLHLNDDFESGPLGSNGGWWRGETIIAPGKQHISLADELKRLMAFLDDSHRSYGTADPLHHRLMRDTTAEPIIRLFEVLYNRIPLEKLRDLWSGCRTDTDGSVKHSDFGILDFSVSQQTPEALRNVYSQWDALFWSNNEVPSFAFIDDPAKVMTIRITSVDGTPADVPEVLYIDRYLKQNVEKSRSMRDQSSLMWRALGKYTAAIAKYTQVTTKKGHMADSRQVLRRLIARSEGLIRQVRARAVWKRHEEQIASQEQPLSYLPVELAHLLDEVRLDEAEQEEVKQLETEIQQTQLRLDRVERTVSRKFNSCAAHTTTADRFTGINAERDVCVANVTRLNQTFTVPSDDESVNPTHSYTLRGVITSMNVVYMCRRKQSEVMEEGAKDAYLNEWYMVSWDGDENQVKHEVRARDSCS